MSSTNRNSSEREEHDFYPTPGWCVARLMEKLDFYPDDQIWLEPCAGNGSIVKNIQTLYPGDIEETTWKLVEIQSRFESDLRAISNNVIIGDYLTTTDIGKVDVIITNPPFSLAFEIIKKSILLRPRLVCMLLRLNFLGSKERSSFMRENTPDIYVLPNRPSFTGKGTDSIEYAWFVWDQRNEYGSQSLIKPATLVILEDTPKEQRTMQQ